MPRGGYFAGGDYMPYTPGSLSKSTPTSRKEFVRPKSVFCPNCRRQVPQRERCVFCDNAL